jgi:hypothetical protein
MSEGQVRAVATDYDTPRKTDEELHEESLEELKAQRVDAQSGQIDVDEAEAAENLELPGAGFIWRRTRCSRCTKTS